jgi:hypothetical protein
VTDSNGKTVAATTDAQGYYRVKVTGFTPPFVAKVTKTDGKVLRSLSVKTLVVNGFITLNLTGLTDKVASDVARAGGKSSAADLTPQIVAQNTAAITSSINAIKTQLASVIADAGIDPSKFDPLGVPFRPDSKGYDYLLDHVNIAVAPDGSVVIAPKTAGTDSGTTWQMHAFIDGTDVSLGTVAGPAVPQTPSQFTASQFATSMSPVAVGNGYSVSGNGNSITITGPGTNYTITVNSFSASGFQYCGSCVPGTEVSVLLSGSFTEGGTLDGVFYPISSTSFSYTFRWVRVG